MTIWKDIVGYEDLYQISNHGDVKSLTRNVECKNGYRQINERILKPIILKLGYKQVALCKERSVKRYSIHRLVAQAFIPNPNNLPCINHKDGNPSNNEIDNLEWCTYGYNSNYYICKERQRLQMLNRYQNDKDFLQSCKDRLNQWHKKRAKKVCQIDLLGNLIKIWDSANATSLSGFIPNDVSQCANHRRKTHHGFIWIWYDDYIERG